ncbi:MAG: thioredoxin-disulfide reductase [Candidatus Omnitrophica bacterium]|nr:thioredoxin-disulfide reductase [Candidatus Omnitrophota bacterium]
MYDLIIIGAGPAGLTAALYAGRYRLKTLILEKLAVGGQILLTPGIENFPGFPGGIATDQLIEQMKNQVLDVGVKIDSEEVLKIEETTGIKPSSFIVTTKDGSYMAKSIIVAVGAQTKRLGAEGEDRLAGRGVSYCGTCDGPLFKNKDIVVVGAGDRAIEDALFLTSHARKVTIIHRRQELRASRILQEKARGNKKITFLLDSVLEAILGKDRVEAVRVKNLKTQNISEIPCQGVFVFVGITPSTGFLKGVLQLDEPGFIITNEEMVTSRTGIFACGDCRKKALYQVVNACGEGAVASYSVNKYILETR